MIAEQLQSLYNVYSDWFLRESPGDGLFSHPALMYAVSCTIAHVVTVWTFHVSMYALYITHSFSQYKIDPKWPEKKLVIKALKGKLLGLAIGDLIAWFSAYYFFLLVCHQPFIYDEPLPSLGTIVWQTVFFFIVNDSIFYWVHRGFHTWPGLYKRFHKQHHEFYQTVSLATEYAHPVEAFFANVLPMFIGPALTEVHFVTFIVWIVLRLWESLDAHCGYEFPWSPWTYFRGSSKFHTYHHSHNRGNYGLFPVWDLLMGTDKSYREHLKSEQKAK